MSGKSLSRHVLIDIKEKVFRRLKQVTKSMYENIVKILAFLGAKRDYSAIDRLGNAIDEISFYEAIRDAIRAYNSYCKESGSGQQIQGESDQEIPCPQIDAQNLINEIDKINSVLAAQDKLKIIKLSRELAVKSYAKIPLLKEETRQEPQSAISQGNATRKEPQPQSTQAPRSQPSEQSEQ